MKIVLTESYFDRRWLTYDFINSEGSISLPIVQNFSDWAMFRSRALRFIFCQVFEKIGMAKTIGDIPYHYNPIESRARMFEVGSISPDRKKLPILGSLPGKDELMPYRFQIFLIENKEINSIDDIDSIYNSFYLASWLP